MNRHWMLGLVVALGGCASILGFDEGIPEESSSTSSATGGVPACDGPRPFSVDGVCCQSPCDGLCETCDVAGNCVPLVGLDPDSECDGDEVCVGDGSCGRAVARWARAFGEGYQVFSGITGDADGNVFLQGSFEKNTPTGMGLIDFGCGSLSAVNSRIFFAKLDPAGECSFSREFGAVTEWFWGGGIAARHDGSVALTGMAEGTVDFGGTPLTSSSPDPYLAVLTNDGAHVFSQSWGTGNLQSGDEVAAYPDGSVVMVGYFVNAINFGGGVLSSAGESDIFVARFDASWQHTWSGRFGDVAVQEDVHVAASSGGDFVIAGIFEGTLNFGGADLVSSGTKEIYVAKLGAAGEHRWSRMLSSSGNDRATVAVDDTGNVIVAGRFGGTMTIENQTLEAVGQDDLYVAKFDPAGEFLWARPFGMTGMAELDAVKACDNGDIVIAGTTELIDFGGGTIGSGMEPDAFIARLNAQGDHLWSRTFGLDNTQWSSHVAVLATGDILLAGGFHGHIDFGVASFTAKSSSGDLFLALLSP